MIRDRLIRFGMPKAQARQARVWLSARPISKWPGWYQDMAFLEAVHRGGARHWAGHTCGLPR
jgi:hypothetical protein